MLAGIFGVLVGLCRGLGLAVPGVCAGFRDSGIGAGMSQHSLWRGHWFRGHPGLAVGRVGAGGAGLGLMGTSGNQRGLYGADPCREPLSGAIVPSRQGHSGTRLLQPGNGTAAVG